jgi:hypothetical protein
VSDVDPLASLLNQACSSLYERGVLEALRVLNDYKFLLPILDIKRFYYFFLNPQAVAFNRDQKKLVKGTADKLKTWAIKLLASSKSNNS